MGKLRGELFARPFEHPVTGHGLRLVRPNDQAVVHVHVRPKSIALTASHRLYDGNAQSPCAKQEERINLNQLFDGYSELDWIGKKSTREDISSNANNPKASLRKYARSLYDTARFINNPLVNSRQATGFDFINHAIDIKRDGDWATKMEAISGMLQHHNEASQGVHGLGPALACDLLKECRCLWFSKPNTHLIGVLQGLGLMQVNDNITTSTEGHANELCRLVYRFAEVARDSLGESRIAPYRVDKMIWLLCTDNFYLEDNRIVHIDIDSLISSAITPRSMK